MKLLAPLLAALALAGCTVGADFQRPEVSTAVAWGLEPLDVASHTFAGVVDVAWWDSFHDAELTSLVDRLGRQNLDLQTAAERIAQARVLRQVAASQGLPQLIGGATVERNRVSPNGVVSLVEPAPGAPLEFNQFDASLSASWELDLFGRVRREVEAAGAQTEAAVAARHAVALSAVADLAQDYMTLRSLQAREDIVRRNLAFAEQRRTLTRNRYDNGVATTLDVAQADAQASTIAQELPSIRTMQAQQINAISLLLAKPPRSLSTELTANRSQPLTPPIVPVGMPGDLLRRRPDIREAEARLHAATAETGVAVASFYPDITLTGSFGFESLQAGTWFNLASRQFLAGPSIDLPIFQGGRLTGTLSLRKSQQREAAIVYRKIVLQAWHDVDDALTAYAEAQHADADVMATVQANARALSAAEDQYQQGVATFLNIIAAQAEFLQSETRGAQSRAQVETSLIHLYKALGGGWQNVEAREIAADQQHLAPGDGP
jgi:NodT family efflux transporter outer membrane factor (OMF) lipoprotein